MNIDYYFKLTVLYFSYNHTIRTMCTSCTASWMRVVTVRTHADTHHREIHEINVYGVHHSGSDFVIEPGPIASQNHEAGDCKSPKT